MAEEELKTEVQTAPQTAPQMALQAAPRAPLREMLTTLKDAGPTFMEMYASDIIDREVAIAKFDQNWRIARVFAESGFFSDVQQVTQAMAKIQLGESWNMAAADAMQHVYFVKGRPAVQNEYLAAKMRDAGLDWEIEWHRDSGQCNGCTLWPSKLQKDGSYSPIMEREGGTHVPAKVSFMKSDAERAGLLKNDTYKNYAEDMFFWRCIARLRRRYATNILSGVLSREEAEDSGDVRDTAPLAIAAPAATATQAAQADIAKQLKERKAAQGVSAGQAPAAQSTPIQTTIAPATAQTTSAAPATAPTAATASPWKDEAGMNILMSDELKRVGEAAMLATATSLGIKPGTLDCKGELTLKFYQALKALPKFAAESRPASEPKTGDMF